MSPRLAPFDVLVLVLAFARGVTSQISQATCQAGFDWTFNSKSQSPCLIAAYLDGACLTDPSGAYVEALAADHHYTLPMGSADDCYCNTVFYSMLAACSTCQGDDMLPWSTWTTNCTTGKFVQEFPTTVPVGTAIPAWAYLDVQTDDNWNLTVARAYAAQNTTEITASGSGSSSSIPSSSSASSTASGSTSSSSASGTPTGVTSSTTSKKSNVGPIVGGVVGGVGGALLLAGLLFFWYRRRSAQRRPPSAQFRQPSPPPMVTTPYSPDHEKTQFSPTAPGFVVPTVSQANTNSVGRLYNPDDPSTFPDAQHNVNSVYSQSTRGSAVFSAQNGYQPAGVHYNGVAEL